MNAIKTPSDYAEHGALGFPRTFDLTAITSFWVNAGFLQKLINSLMMSAGVAILAVTISLLNAYAIGIGRVKGGYTLLLILLMTIMAPQEALIYPLYYMLKWVGLFDNLYALIVIIAVLMSAFGTYLLASVMSTFPREIIEAAQLDNASRWQILWKVVVPILWPTLSVLATFFLSGRGTSSCCRWSSWLPMTTRRFRSPWASCRAQISRTRPELLLLRCSASCPQSSSSFSSSAL